MRAEETLARMGGDELVVLLEGVTDEQLPVETARRLLGEMAPEFTVGETHVAISASIGVALGASSSQRDLRHAADQAMYAAKRSGPGRIVVTSPEAVAAGTLPVAGSDGVST